MTLDKCIVFRIGTLTGCPLSRESHPLCRLKNPAVISIWLLVGFHPSTRSVQSTPADNTRKRVWQYIEKERNIQAYQTALNLITLNIANSGLPGSTQSGLNCPVQIISMSTQHSQNKLIYLISLLQLNRFSDICGKRHTP